MLCFLFVSLAVAQAQTRVTGKVTSSEDGTPVAYAAITVKGKTNIGTVTNEKGEYTITVPEGFNTLQVNIVGMIPKEVDVTGRKIVDIVLDPDATNIDEVLVVAYGTINKSSYTGAATQIDSKSIEMRPISNITQALSGLSAGVQVSGGSGQPGVGPTIRIRGVNSINGENSPLYVVDGAPYENALSSINPDDIETLTVLKDASSAALYGARAANGVVIITTKKGREGKGKFGVKITQGFSTPQLPDYETIGRDDFYPLTWEKLRNTYIYKYGYAENVANQMASDNVYSQVTYNPYNVPNDQIVGLDGKLNPNAQFMWADDLDWRSPIKRLGYRADYGLNYSGGTSKTDYYVSLGFVKEDGYIIKSDFKRSSIRANVNTQATRWLKVGVNMNGNISDGNNTMSNSTYGNPFYGSLYMAQIYPVHLHDRTTGEYILDSDGNKQWDFGNGVGDLSARPANAAHHMIAELMSNSDRFRRSLLSAKTYAEIKLMKDLKFTTNYTVDLNTYYTTTYTAPMEGIASPGNSYKQTSQRLTWNWNQLLQYTKKLGQHDIDVMAGHEAFSTSIFAMSGTKRNQIAIGNDELVNFTNLESLTSTTNDYRTEGYFVRGNYSFKSRYMASFSFRADASSKFHKDYRWGTFWSAGLAWRIEQEKFMENVRFVDHLKLRTTYGQVGNDAGVGNYAWQSLYSIAPNADEPGFALKSLGNKALRWESNNNFDVAIEFGLFKRLEGTFEFFNKQSDNMLYSRELNSSTGFANIDENAFTMRNRGFEIDLSGDIISRPKGVSWNMSVNATHYQNKITYMPNAPYPNGTKRIETGHSIYDYYLRDYVGVNPGNGDALYRTDEAIDGKDVFEFNGQTVTNKLDRSTRYFSGKSAIPKVFGGIINNISWKNFSLNITMTYQLGGWMYDGNYEDLMTYTTSTYGRNMHKDMLNRWQNPGDVTNVPRMDVELATDICGANSTRWLVRSNFLDISSINLTYQLPKKIINKLELSNMSVYATVDNVYQFNARKGMDARSSFNGTTSFGYTPARTFTLGVNLTF